MRILNINKSIPHSLTLQIKRICSTAKDFEHHTQELKERFVKQVYNQKLINDHIQNVNELNRSELFKEKHRNYTKIAFHLC